MPEQPLKIASYAAGASLAAITLVYVFAPTFFIDGESATSTASSRKKTIVGLSNPANDCFINSVLQALAGLGDLRIYLIRETHRRKLDGAAVYAQLVDDPARKNMPAWKIEGLQAGTVTKGLKDILNSLNERPIYKKTISAGPFVLVLEQSFKQRISRQQQDAQEFLQVVAERLCDEYHAGHRARKHAYEAQSEAVPIQLENGSINQKLDKLSLDDPEARNTPKILVPSESSRNGNGSISYSENDDRQVSTTEKEEGFPLEGVSESQIECLTCGFKPTPSKSTFCSLTLSVPQVSSTTLSTCFDQMFKTEYIEDFKCEKCRLIHALETYQQEFTRSTSDKFKAKTELYINKIKHAIETNPEDELKDVELPDRKFAPKRKIAKHTQITDFPKVMAIHLSRSIFDAGRSTLKNSAKVSFPERLPLGGLINQHFYRLSSVVCHKGSHHSGHYESFRRQALSAPFSTPNTFQPAGVYSKPPTPNISQMPTPQIGASHQPEEPGTDTSTLSSTPELLSPSSAASSSPSLPYLNGEVNGDSLRPNGRTSGSPTSSISTSTTVKTFGPTSAPRGSDTASIRSIARSTRSAISTKLTRSKDSSSSTPSPTPTPQENGARKDGNGDPVAAQKKRKSKHSNRWWRISDDKIKESKTSDVLGMQREVYLLFYELERDE
ncbi:U1biquitin-specific peptidase-like protein [Cadophora sp. MPI-SDFR-AT-0126]|nr:U1biquitin-specific peptidase-like protein [Leotiomycetes sp. MPI-SDFR-AT-0126]